MKIFTDEYICFLKEIEQVQSNYKRNPCISTLQAYTRLKKQNWNAESRFTQEYLNQFKAEQKERELTFAEQFEWLYESMMIDVKYDRNLISSDERVVLHANNNNKYNIN